MAIANYTDLKTAIAAHADRTDLTAQMDNFTILAEAGFNRALRVKGMEATLASTALTSGAVTHPTGFQAWKELRYDSDRDYTLQPKSLEWIRAQDDTNTDPAQYFAVDSTQTVCWPTGGPVKGTYLRTIPSLTGTATNWLLTAWPDIYLFGCLTELAIYVRDTEGAVMYRDRTRSLLDELQRRDDMDSFEGGVLAVRAR